METTRRCYTQPPIQEAVCEFRFPEALPWDMATPGLLFPGLKGDYPVRKQRTDAEPRLVQNTKGEPALTFAKVERIAYSAEDGKSFVQVGPRAVSVHKLSPYSSWEDFRGKVTRVHSVLLDVVGATPLERVGLRYINRLEAVNSPADLSDFLRFRPECGPGVTEPMSNVQMACTFGARGGADSYRVMLVSLVPDDEQKAALALDIDYFTCTPGVVKYDSVLAWVEAAHSKVESVFEGCITDKLRGLFR